MGLSRRFQFWSRAQLSLLPQQGAGHFLYSPNTFLTAGLTAATPVPFLQLPRRHWESNPLTSPSVCIHFPLCCERQGETLQSCPKLTNLAHQPCHRGVDLRRTGSCEMSWPQRDAWAGQQDSNAILRAARLRERGFPIMERVNS